MNFPEKASNEQKLRSLSVGGGTRQTSLRLDTVTWAAIDHLAAREGLRWQEWANRVIDANRGTSNMAGELRKAVIEQLLANADQGSAQIQLPEPHTMLGTSYSKLNDADLADKLADAFILHRDDSFESFSVIVGFLNDEARQPFLCVQNRLRGAQHMFAALQANDDAGQP